MPGDAVIQAEVQFFCFAEHKTQSAAIGKMEPVEFEMVGGGADFPQSATDSLRLCASGGASLPVQVLHDFEKTFGCMILEGYGLSETSPVASFNHPDRER